jgi:hypothetical protein
MNRNIPALIIVLAVLAVVPAFAAQSRTTEYHQTGLKIATAKTFNINLPDGYFVTGFLKGPTGVPVKDATVYIGDEADGYSGLGGATDAAGKFSVPVQPGNKFLGIGPPGSASLNPAQFSRLLNKTVAGVNVVGDASAGEIRLENGFVLSGKVNPPAGSGALFIFIPVIDVFPPTGLDIVDVAQVGEVNKIVLDRYAMALPAGTYRVLTRAAGATVTLQGVPMLPRQDRITISKDTVKNITMPRGGYPFWGTVKDSAKRSLDGVLHIIPKSGSFKGWPIQSVMVVKGVFGVLPGLNIKNLAIPAGQYMLMFMPTVYLTSGYAGRATVTYYNLTMPAASKTLALVAANGFVVSGKTTDARGKAVKAMITAFKENAPLGIDTLKLNFMAAVSDAKGLYRFALPADTFNLYAIPISTAPADQKAEELMGRMFLKAVSSFAARLDGSWQR